MAKSGSRTISRRLQDRVLGWRDRGTAGHTTNHWLRQPRPQFTSFFCCLRAPVHTPSPSTSTSAATSSNLTAPAQPSGTGESASGSKVCRKRVDCPTRSGNLPVPGRCTTSAQPPSVRKLRFRRFSAHKAGPVRPCLQQNQSRSHACLSELPLGVYLPLCPRLQPWRCHWSADHPPGHSLDCQPTGRPFVFYALSRTQTTTTSIDWIIAGLRPTSAPLHRYQHTHTHSPRSFDSMLHRKPGTATSPLRALFAH
jgi:hypothetical protein